MHKFSSNESYFATARGNSYQCDSKTVIKGFMMDANVTVTSVDLENLRIQPFVDDSKEFNGFGDGMDLQKKKYFFFIFKFFLLI